MLNKNILFSIFFVFFAGLLIGKLLNWGYFELTKEISIIDALTLLATVGMAIYITGIVEKKVQDKRIEKEFYIAKIAEIESLMRDLENILEQDKICYTRVKTLISSLRSKKQKFFKKILKMEEVQGPIKTKLISFDKDIKNTIDVLKPLLTDTPLKKDKNVQITMKKGILTYCSERKNDINARIDDINDLLFEMKLVINKM